MGATLSPEEKIKEIQDQSIKEADDEFNNKLQGFCSGRMFGFTGYTEDEIRSIKEYEEYKTRSNEEKIN